MGRVTLSKYLIPFSVDVGVFSLPVIYLGPNYGGGEGNGTPLQYSCLENPIDRRAWKAAIHGVAEGQT